MKKITLFVAALAAVCSCNKSEVPTVEAQNNGEAFIITAESVVCDQTKVTMGEKTGSVYPISWSESGERVFLREVVRDTDPAKTTTADTGSVSFTKIDAKTAKFVFQLAPQTKETVYDYAAVYPCNPDGIKKDLTHGVRQGGSDAKNRVSYMLNHTVSQVPLADRPDPTTHILMAVDTSRSAQAESLNLNFKYVVGFGKMTVKNFPALASGETVSKITVTVPVAQKMTGRKYHYFKANTDGSHKAGDIIPYSSTTVMNYVMIDPKNITFNTTGFDVWFTTYPIELVKDDIVSLKVETSDSTYTANIALSKALKFQSGVVSEFIYDYEKGQPKKETKTLTFDFENTALTDWPTATGWANDSCKMVCTFPLDKVNYEFTLQSCTAKDVKIWYGVSGSSVTSIILGGRYRYLGFPVLTGYKLVKFEAPLSLTSSKSSRKIAIVDYVEMTVADPAYNVGGCTNSVVANTPNAVTTFNLTGTKANTRYYLYCALTSWGTNKITLTYEKVD